MSSGQAHVRSAPLLRSSFLVPDVLRRRCVMSTYDPDVPEKEGEVLSDIHRRFGGVLALNAAMLRPGVVHVGDPVRMFAHDETREILAAES